MIPLNILKLYKPELKSYKKNQSIFNEHETPKFYFQIKTGGIKMLNRTEDGKEFVQGFFEDNSAFGEPPLFGDFKYPASAICTSDSEIHVLPKASFFKLLKDNPEIHINFTKSICKRMIYKATIMKEVSVHPPEHRILTLLNHLKLNSNTNEVYEVKLTRQQISDLTGLRVETVIRAIKSLEKSKKLSIKERKVYI